MGNAVMCSGGSMPASGQVRVLQAGGKMLHFEHPVLAIQVMQEHPEYLVVKCGPSSISNGMLGKESYASLTYDRIKQLSCKHNVAMLRADEELDPRSTYYMLPLNAKKPDPAWNFLSKALKTSSKVASSFEFEQKNDSSPAEKKFSILRPGLRRSRSMPHSRESRRQLQEEQQQQQNRQPQNQPQNFTPSVSIPSRAGNQYLGNPFMEGVGRRRELPPMSQTLRNKRPRRMVRPPQTGWTPILASIAEVVDEFSDVEDFYRMQTKCLRRLHTFQSCPDKVLSTTAHLRAVAV